MGIAISKAGVPVLLSLMLLITLLRTNPGSLLLPTMCRVIPAIDIQVNKNLITGVNSFNTMMKAAIRSLLIGIFCIRVCENVGTPVPMYRRVYFFATSTLSFSADQ